MHSWSWRNQPAWNAGSSIPEDEAVDNQENGVTLGAIESDTVASDSPATPLEVVQSLVARLDAGEDRAYGFPAARNGIDYSPLYPLLARPINNIGDPGVPAAEPRHCKDLEQEVIRALGRLFGRDCVQLWGYITTGSTEAIRHALLLARHRLPDAVLYYSDAAHYCLAKAANVLRMPSVRIPTSPSGELDYTALGYAVRSRPAPVIVAATAGTPMSEAVDDVRRIREVLADRPHYLHVDAALSGFALAVGWPELLTDSDSISVSGHKLLGVPQPSGALLACRHDVERIRRSVAYIASDDTTEAGSRAGQLSLLWWWTMQHLGAANGDISLREGLSRIVVGALRVAEYAHGRLQALGWGPRRHPWGLTVRFAKPPTDIVHRWGLSTDQGYARLITVPGVTFADVDRFTADLGPAPTRRVAG
jgi:histidine decarboxylase